MTRHPRLVASSPTDPFGTAADGLSSGAARARAPHAPLYPSGNRIIRAALVAAGLVAATAAGAAGISVPAPNLPPGCTAVSRSIANGKVFQGATCKNGIGSYGCLCTALLCKTPPKVRNAACQPDPH